MTLYQIKNTIIKQEKNCGRKKNASKFNTTFPYFCKTHFHFALNIKIMLSALSNRNLKLWMNEYLDCHKYKYKDKKNHHSFNPHASYLFLEGNFKKMK